MLTRRRRSAIIPEAELQAACALALDQLLMPPAIWFSAGIGALQLSARQAARLKAAGVKPNIPDLLFIYEGLVFGIELKTRRGQLSTTRIVRTRSGGARVVLGQQEGFDILRQAGMTIGVCRSVEEVLGQLERWGLPTRVRAVPDN